MENFAGSMLYSTAMAMGRRGSELAGAAAVAAKAAVDCKKVRRSMAIVQRVAPCDSLNQPGSNKVQWEMVDFVILLLNFRSFRCS